MKAGNLQQPHLLVARRSAQELADWEGVRGCRSVESSLLREKEALEQDMQAAASEVAPAPLAVGTFSCRGKNRWRLPSSVTEARV